MPTSTDSESWEKERRGRKVAPNAERHSTCAKKSSVSAAKMNSMETQASASYLILLAFDAGFGLSASSPWLNTRHFGHQQQER